MEIVLETSSGDFFASRHDTIRHARSNNGSGSKVSQSTVKKMCWSHDAALDLKLPVQ